MKVKTMAAMSQSVADTLTNLAEVCEALGRKEEAVISHARSENYKQASADA